MAKKERKSPKELKEARQQRKIMADLAKRQKWHLYWKRVRRGLL